MILTAEQKATILSKLNGKGESLEELKKTHDCLVVENDFIEDQLPGGMKLTINPKGTAKSDEDRGLYKIRYKYTAYPQPQTIGTSRDFCISLIGIQGDKVFRKEDIDAMQGENSEFGDYSIFQYKGSYGCRHRWQRLIFFRKQKGGKFLPNKGLDNDKRVANAPYVRRAGEESKVNKKPRS